MNIQAIDYINEKIIRRKT